MLVIDITIETKVRLVKMRNKNESYIHNSNSGSSDRHHNRRYFRLRVYCINFLSHFNSNPNTHSYSINLTLGFSHLVPNFYAYLNVDTHSDNSSDANIGSSANSNANSNAPSRSNDKRGRRNTCSAANVCLARRLLGTNSGTANNR